MKRLLLLIAMIIASSDVHSNDDGYKIYHLDTSPEFLKQNPEFYASLKAGDGIKVGVHEAIFYCDTKSPIFDFLLEVVCIHNGKEVKPVVTGAKGQLEFNNVDE
mgnify:FL=1|jgi:hypothetical protein